MNSKFFGTLSVFVIALVTVIIFQQYTIIQNQHTQMRQQFHSDQIAIVSLLGNDGLTHLLSESEEGKEMSVKNIFATGLLLQRLILSYNIRNSFSDKQWKGLVQDARITMQLPIMRKQWKTVQGWYTDEERAFVDQFVK